MTLRGQAHEIFGPLFFKNRHESTYSTMTLIRCSRGQRIRRGPRNNRYHEFLCEIDKFSKPFSLFLRGQLEVLTIKGSKFA